MDANANANANANNTIIIVTKDGFEAKLSWKKDNNNNKFVVTLSYGDDNFKQLVCNNRGFVDEASLISGLLNDFPNQQRFEIARLTKPTLVSLLDFFSISLSAPNDTTLTIQEQKFLQSLDDEPPLHVLFDNVMDAARFLGFERFWVKGASFIASWVKSINGDVEAVRSRFGLVSGGGGDEEKEQQQWRRRQQQQLTAATKKKIRRMKSMRSLRNV